MADVVNPLSEMVEALAGKLGKLPKQEYALLRGVRADIEFLERELRSMSTDVQFCESLDNPDSQTRGWVGRVRELACDVDDWVELLAVQVNDAAGISGNPSSTFLGWIRSTGRRLKTLLTSRKICTMLRSFKKRVTDLNTGRNGCKSHSARVSFDAPVSTAVRSARPQIDQDSLVGLEGPMEEVAKMVKPATDDVEIHQKIISIVGMAGSGKTTLAQLVYWDLGEQSYFQCCAFVSLGLKSHEVSNTLKDLMGQLGERPSGEDEKEQLIIRIREILKKKRYLIVVDDLWRKEQWESIKICFPENNRGSRIITTTRNAALATDCSLGSSGSVYKIDLLSPADSEKLFLMKVFGPGCSCPDDFEGIVTRIVTRCGGLPLALVCVAAMLVDKKKDEWERIALDFSSNPGNMKQIINLSYIDLPPLMKTLMLYFSIFPDNYVVKVDRLVRLWAGERLIGISAEKGRNCLSELFTRNLVEPVPLNQVDFPRSCRLHPVIRDFVVVKSKEENFVTLVDDDKQAPTNHNKARRLSLQYGSKHDQALVKIESIGSPDHVHSIIVFGRANLQSGLTNLRVVRVLALEGFNGTVCLDGLENLLLLRYLSLRGTDVKELPEKIGLLRYLQTLDVRSTKVKELPNSIVELQNTLETLLVKSDVMINSTETATRKPEDIGLFRRLETLATVHSRYQSASFLNALGGLDGLRVLGITWTFDQSTNEDYCKALLLSIRKWSKLRSLKIHCGFGCSMEFLDSLSQAPEKLEMFKVKAGRFLHVPKWIEGLKSLSFVQITVCRLEKDDLKILGELAKLQCLKLGLEYIPEKAIVINQQFKELLKFSVDCPVPWLTFHTGVMPKLTYLQLNVCSGPASKERVPSGICNLQRLREVVLCCNKKCYANSFSVKMTVKAMQSQVGNHHNRINLDIRKVPSKFQKVDIQSDAEETMSTTVETLGDDKVEADNSHDKGV